MCRFDPYLGGKHTRSSTPSKADERHDIAMTPSFRKNVLFQKCTGWLAVQLVLARLIVLYT